MNCPSGKRRSMERTKHTRASQSAQGDAGTFFYLSRQKGFMLVKNGTPRFALLLRFTAVFAPPMPTPHSGSRNAN